MTLKIGFLAIGEGGSNIGEYAAQKGFNVVAINSAKVDLDKLKSIPKDCRIHLEGWEGAGRNREIGKEAVLVHAEEILKKVSAKFDGYDIVFVTTSTAGGTGSGGIPVCIEILNELDTNIGAITILPDKNESAKAHMNALECFSELSQYEDLNSVFIIDNEKANQIFKGNNKTSIYQLSIKQLIDNMTEICSLINKPSLVSNFDKNDLLSILTERGCTIVSKIIVPVEELKEPNDIIKVIRNSWENICFPDFDYGQIVKAGIFGKVPIELTSKIDVKEVFKETGLPYDIIEAYYLNEDHKNHAIFYTILSGLSFPLDRLKQMEKEVKEIEQELISKLETSRKQVFQTDNWGSKFKKETHKQMEKKLSLTERLAKFK